MQAPDDPGLYGSSFADVYDDWYPGGDEDHVVAALVRHLPRRSRVLELGVGTGRIALPLVGAGFEVVGMDASPEMLDAITAKDPQCSVRRVLADAGDPGGWAANGLEGSFDCVLAACNLLLNLASPRDQHECVTGVGDRLRGGGVFAVELQQVHPDATGDITYAMSGATGDAPVVIATRTDPVTTIVQGEHIELRADGTSQIRSWSLCPIDLATLDSWCLEAGLNLIERHSDWSTGTWHPDSPTSVSTYRRSA